MLPNEAKRSKNHSRKKYTSFASKKNPKVAVFR